MLKTEPIKKIHFSIQEVADKFNIPPSTIRFWESKFDYLKPTRTSTGRRVYTEDDIQRLALVYHYLHERKLTIEGTRLKLKQNKHDNDNYIQVIQKLNSIKEQLQNLLDILPPSKQTEET